MNDKWTNFTIIVSMGVIAIIVVVSNMYAFINAKVGTEQSSMLLNFAKDVVLVVVGGFAGHLSHRQTNVDAGPHGEVNVEKPEAGA